MASGCGGPGNDGPPGQVIQVNLTEAGCSPSTVNAFTGPARFVIQNPASSGTNSFELRSGNQVVFSVSNVLGGLSRGGTITLEAGTYTMRCAGGGTDASGQVIVTDEE